jgi:CoA:oxalate CoA-transferase
LVENFKPGVMAAMKLDWPTVHARHPQIVMASVSGFGQTGGPDGARPAMDVVIQAMSGMMDITGFNDKPPAGAGVPIADLTSGMYASIGVMAALLGRSSSGKGAYVDVAMLDSMAAIMSSVTVRQIAGAFDANGYPRQTGSRSTGPFGIYPCQDGAYIAIIGVQPHFYASLCEVLSRPAMVTDSRFKNAMLRGRNKDTFNEALHEALSHKPMREWVQLLQAKGVPCGPVNDLKSAVDEPQLQHRGMLVRSADGIDLVGNPIKISGYDQPTVLPALDQAKTDIHTILSKL